MFPRAFATISEPVFKASQVFEEFANFEKVKLVFKGSAMSELDLPQDLKVKILELEALQARPEAALIQEMQDLLTALKSQYKKQGITRIKNDLKTASQTEALQLMQAMQNLINFK